MLKSAKFEGRATLSVLNEHPQSKIQNFSVETVRNLLKIDNKGIAQLCAKVSLMPKKDIQGRTYFTKDDLEILRRIKNICDRQRTIKRSNEPAPKTTKAYATVPMKKSAAAFAKQQIKESQKPQEKQQPKVPQKVEGQITPAAAVVDRLCNSLVALENSLVSKLSKMVDEKLGSKLDEKLEGMDEVVVELVRCKTENETLRYKMNELNKEIYNLKNELSKYKSLGFGFFVKRNGDSSLL